MYFERSEIPNDLLEFFEPAGCGSCFVCRMVEVFREVRRVLRDDGTLWLNLGDSYGAGGRKTQVPQSVSGGNMRDVPAVGRVSGFAKSLLGIPWRVAFALQADGWYLRSDIIWHKPNPMPESVRDRPTKAHEYLFLLSKSATYHYDADAVREPHCEEVRKAIGKIGGRDRAGKSNAPPGQAPHGNLSRGGNNNAYAHPLGRNRRSVFSVETVHAKLRSDLSPQQKSYIIGELIQRGLL